MEGTLLRVTKNCAEVSAMTGRQTLPQTGPNWHVAAAFGISPVLALLVQFYLNQPDGNTFSDISAWLPWESPNLISVRLVLI